MNAAPTRIHWADEIAERLAADGRPQVISSGISPSGEIHIGNMRDVLTADAVYRAARERGVEVAFNFVADNWPKECDGNKQDLEHGRRMPSLDHRYVHLYGFKRTPARAA